MRGLTLGDPALLGAAAGFSPLSLSPALWLDASDAATITSSGGLVSQWNDKSGNGRNVTQATSTSQPATGTNTQNGRNVITFDGINDFMSSGSWTAAQPMTVIAAYRFGVPTSSNNFATLVDGSSTSTGSRAIVFQRRSDASNQISMFAGTVANSSLVLANNTAYIDVAVFNGSSSSRSINGTSYSLSANPGTAGVTAGVRIGWVGGAGYFIGNACEILVIPSALTAAQQSAVIAYLNSRWAVY